MASDLTMQPKAVPKRWRVSLIALLCLLTAVELLWLTQPTAFALVLYLPHSVWACCGVILSLLALRKRTRVVLAVTWLLIALGHSEAVWSVPRGWVEGDSLSAGRTRVVSLNCNVGSIKAAREVRALKPQLVLLQETPGEEFLRELAQELWAKEGAIVVTPECAILARGELRRVAVGPRFDWVLVDWTDLDGDLWLVASLRLAPPCSRLDVWSSEFRDEHVATVSRRLETLQLLKTAIEHAKTPRHRIVIGGDFNMVAYDRTLRVLEPLLVDAFARGGIGWGDTVLNDFPFQRFDQIWVDRHLSDVSCRAVRTQHSDHRLVVCDVGGS